MQFLEVTPDFPISSAVIHSGRVFEAVVTGIPDDSNQPVPGGAAAEMREIFRQLDNLLHMAGIDKTAICSVRLYLQHVNRDIKEVNEVYKDYFATHPPNRRAYGVDLQAGMLIEAAFVAEMPESR
jgi:enamine deaminase RidA (YjgF/YER057c/UK114 family)